MIMTETLEKVAGKYATDMGGDFHQGIYNAFKKGAKWQQERMYREEEVHHIIQMYSIENYDIGYNISYDEWFEQFKKK